MSTNELIQRRSAMMQSSSGSIDWESIAYQLMTGDGDVEVDCVIPEGVTSIRPYAFRQCWFNTISFPSTLRTIGQEAFEYLHQVKIIELGENIQSIGNWAFQSVYDVQRFIIHTATPPTIGGGTFSGSYPIYVPDASVNDYKAAANWSNLASRIFPISDLPTT